MGRRRGQRGGSRLVPALAAAACALVGIVAVATAEDTTETSTFGRDGIATQSLGVHFEETGFSTVDARPDGGLVALRGDQLESYLADGAPDPAFPPRRVSPSRRVFPLAGGKSLVAVDVFGDSQLTRVNPDGNADPGFGDAGAIRVPVGVQAATELPSGEIVIAGVFSGGTHELFNAVEIALVNPDGSLSPGLGSNGALRLQLPSNQYVGGVSAILPTGDGGALLVGGTFLLKLRADGSPDLDYGSGGLVTELPTALVGGRILSDGSLEAVGSSTSLDALDLVVLRYTATGRPDTGFGAEGIRMFDLGGDERAHDASWAADGSVVVGGSSLEAGACAEAETCREVPILAAFDPDGSLDPGFGDSGVLRLTALAGASRDWFHSGITSLARRPDGSIVAAGVAPPERTVAFLAALSPEGALLPGFGEGGIVRVRREVPAIQLVGGLARLASGKLLAAGTTDVGYEYSPILVRYDADGSLDRSFGAGDGYVTLSSSRFTSGFAVDASGRALVGVSGYPRNRLVLSDADGAPVSSFGAGGVVELPRRVWVEALGFSAGDAVVVGTRDVAGNAEPGVVLRFDPDGTPAPGFGTDGRVSLRPGGRQMKARTLATLPGGRILVGGIVGNRFAMVRLLPDGRPDTRFGARGWSSPSAGGTPLSVKVSRAGSHVYLAGVARDGDRVRVVLLRYRPDGRPDPSFGSDGRRTATISKSARPTAIVPTRSGTLVVLSRGPRPLLLFGRDGGVKRRWVGKRPTLATDVRATVSGGQLFLGWNAPSEANPRDAFYLGRRALP
ncbi:MAG TPA: delta-60 repeat domain-containing protein [Solirubrobacterales bacterium]|jgi:uncharacterized delta-60 repeat protein|nr:delta-60 repeat domain-containing protein [Solirubrobacterales bacterium]